MTVIAETIRNLFARNQNPSAEDVLAALDNMGIEQEWAVAEYFNGTLDSISHHGYSIEDVVRHADKNRKIVTRAVTHWTASG